MELNEQLAEGHRSENRADSPALYSAMLAAWIRFGFVDFMTLFFMTLLEDTCEGCFGVFLSLSDSAHEAEANSFETIGSLTTSLVDSSCGRHTERWGAAEE